MECLLLYVRRTLEIRNSFGGPWKKNSENMRMVSILGQKKKRILFLTFRLEQKKGRFAINTIKSLASLTLLKALAKFLSFNVFHA
jgi:hypothetical protein